MTPNNKMKADVDSAGVIRMSMLDHISVVIRKYRQRVRAAYLGPSAAFGISGTESFSSEIKKGV
jgi:hypothetical protein